MVLITLSRIRRIVVGLTTASLLAWLAAAGGPPARAQVGPDPGDTAAEGAFTCDLTIAASNLGDPSVAAVIERDRMYMAEQPGMLFKHIPLRIDPVSRTLQSGGRYLFGTHQQAVAYKAWVETEFALDGVKFFDRPIFLSYDCHAWSTIGARQFADIHDSQVVLRTERWAVPADNQRVLLRDRWPTLRAAAAARGLSAVWLLYQRQERLVSIVYFSKRLVPKNDLTPDFVSLTALETAAPLGAIFDDQAWSKVMDRTQWSWTIWFPFVPGDRGEPSLWPHSPPLPEPSTTDGVCEVSRGENAQTAPNDCSARCGDALCQPEDGENTMSCPGDCRDRG